MMPVVTLPSLAKPARAPFGDLRGGVGQYVKCRAVIITSSTDLGRISPESHCRPEAGQPMVAIRAASALPQSSADGDAAAAVTGSRVWERQPSLAHPITETLFDAVAHTPGQSGQSGRGA